MTRFKVAVILIIAGFFPMMKPSFAQPTCTTDQVMQTLLVNLIKLANAQSQGGTGDQQAAQEVQQSLQALSNNCYGSVTPVAPTAAPVLPTLADTLVVPSPTAEPTQEASGTLVTALRAATIYKNESTDHSTGVTVNACDQVTRTGQSGKWVRIDYIELLTKVNPPEKSGYVNSGLFASWLNDRRVNVDTPVKLYANLTDQKEFSILPAAQNIDVESDPAEIDQQVSADGGLYKVRLHVTANGQSGYVNAADLTPWLIGRRIKVDYQDGVNIHQSPNGVVSGGVPKDTDLLVQKTSNDGQWLVVEPHETGYIDGKLLDDADISPGAKVVTRTTVNMRATADANAAVLMVLNGNSTLIYLGLTPDHQWANVTTDAKQPGGWVTACRIQPAAP